MAGVSTQFTIQDRMTAKLQKMTGANEKLNRTLETTDRLTEQVDGDNYDRLTAAVIRTADGLDRLNQRQEEAAQKAKKAENQFAKLLNTIKNLAVVRFAQTIGKQVLELSDTLTSMHARLNLMNDGQQTTEELQNKIMQSANRSRSSFLATADAVAKLGVNAREAFNSNDELIAFSEAVNKAFVISGATAEEQKNAMLQLTQAMASGVLRGDELRSVFEQAPILVQTIAKYLDVPIGKIREMAAEGQITAEIVKNAMLKYAGDIDKAFNDMPMTFAQAWTLATNAVLQVLTPLLTAIGQGAQWIYDNWSMIAPVFWGVAAAVLAYAAATAIWTAVTWLADAANRALIAGLLTNPILWVAVAIGILVGVIYNWIQATGGIQVAWMKACDWILTAWDMVKIGFMAGVYWVMDLMGLMSLAFYSAGITVANYMSDMKADVLLILQNMINGAIAIINAFICALNKIPGINIELIDQFTFGAMAQLDAEAAKQARAADLADYQAQVEAAMKDRDAALKDMRAQAEANAAQRDAEISAAQAAAAAGDKGAAGDFDFGAGAANLSGAGGKGGAGNVGHVDSVGAIEEPINIAKEDLKFLRDVAEMRYVQNFVTLTPTVAMNAQISKDVDVDALVGEIAYRLESEFEAAAEGVYA